MVLMKRIVNMMINVNIPTTNVTNISMPPNVWHQNGCAMAKLIASMVLMKAYFVVKILATIMIPTRSVLICVTIHQMVSVALVLTAYNWMNRKKIVPTKILATNGELVHNFASKPHQQNINAFVMKITYCCRINLRAEARTHPIQKLYTQIDAS